MKRNGNYTLFIGCPITGKFEDGRKVTSIEWEKVKNFNLQSFNINYVSAHYPNENRRIGVVLLFKLKNNITNEIKEYKADKR